jgi:hypothetical protein
MLNKTTIISTVCPSCNLAFKCNSNDISTCQCNNIELSKKALDYIQLHYKNKCLCINCIKHINQGIS